MCGIALIPKSKLCDTLENQKIRGLDSLGIIDFQSNDLITAYKPDLVTYQEYIKANIEDNDELCFMHHRKASIGAISLDNAHPFIGKKFILAQNGTSKDFMTEYGYVYGKETDSETILCYLEEKCNTLEEIITELDLITCPLGIIFIFHKGKTLIYADACRGSFMHIEDTTEEVDGEQVITKSTLVSFTNLKDKSVYEYRNGFNMILDSITGVIESEWNYDDEFNKEIYGSAFTHGKEEYKKTQVTKKNGTGPTGGNKFKPAGPHNNQTAIIIDKKSKKKGIYSGKKKNKFTSMQKALENITILTKDYVFDDFEDAGEVEIMLDNYGVTRSLNPTASTALAESVFDFISDQENYRYVYEIADREIFNYDRKDSPDVFVDYLFALPIKYLMELEILPRRYLTIKLIRHMRLLNKFKVDDHVNYYLALEYIAEGLDNIELFPLTLETFLFAMYEMKPSEQDHTFITSGINPAMEDIVKGFILAGYAFGLTAKHMNIEVELYNNLTSKY